MTTIQDETGAQIARRLYLERTSRGWSQADLAARSGVSKAAISKIERTEMSPTAVILVRLASAFDLTLAGLLLRAEGTGERLSRAADQVSWRDPATQYLRRQVFMRPDHPLELVQIELPAGQRIALLAASYARIRQLVWVQVGELVILEGQVRAVLGAGDCLGFGSPSDVVFANESGQPCRYSVLLARS
ncbi:helix-turn-helix transcriptional regulator [Deinococcus sp.]|uniref:helix-turn-helix domain-containing protein n=1 Tax=Deinococcus sp. TaxID=47478 RepID=UPI0025D2C723|nr:helix-turn-helix transcriptional regulator [Deinococcus sp.]